MKKVSVIIPAYNVEDYIDETLQSFINQTLQDIEIIVVDDGSTDSTCKILEKYQQMDNRISILHQENKGAGIARNLGMEHATGEYLYFFDADDYCIPSFLQSVVQKADRTQADIVVFDYYRIDHVTKKEILYHGLNRSLFPKDKDYFNYKDLPNRILSIVNPTPWNKLYRRSYIQDTNLQYLGLSTTNDITFASLSVAMANKVVYLGKPFMYYRINRKEAITSFKQKKLNNVIAAIESVIEQASMLPYYNEIKNAVMYFSVNNLIFALEHFAGEFRSKYYREYYKNIHKLFQRDLFIQITKNDFNNDKLFKKFREVQKYSYGMRFLIKIKRKCFRKLKIFIKGILPLTKRQFERQSKKTLRKHSAEIRKICVLTRQVKKLSSQVRTLTYLQQQQNIDFTNQITTLIQVFDNLNWNGLSTTTRTPRIIVSMTSFPSRIWTVKQTILSIMAQTIKADKIILWLAKTNFPSGEAELPEGLLKLKDKGLEIRWCDEDYCSYKKILPSLKEFPEDIILTVDDDLIYSPTMIEQLYDSYKQHPESISAMRTHQITFEEDGSIKPYSEWKKENSDYIGTPRMDLFATTGAGTLFPPHCLPKITTDWSTIKEICPYADDIWIKIMSLINHVPVVLIAEQKKLQYVPGTQTDRLWEINRTENDTQLNNLLKMYHVSFNEKNN